MEKTNKSKLQEKLSSAKSLVLGYSIALRDLPVKNRAKLLITDCLDGFDGLRSMNEVVTEIEVFCKRSDNSENTDDLNEIKEFLSDFKSEYNDADLFIHMNHVTDNY